MAFIGNTPTTQAFTPAVDYFSGNASTTAFTLSRPVASVAQVQVVVNNVAQNPSSAYTISSNTITFTSAPSSGTNNIYVYYTSPITQVIAPSQGSVNTTSLGNITNIASSNSNLTLQTGSGNTTAVTVDTSQNVGIGTTSPLTKLQVSSPTTTASGSIAWETNGATLNLSYTGAGATDAGSSVNFSSLGVIKGAQDSSGGGNGYLSFLTRNGNGGQYATERMRITSAGVVGIGATPAAMSNGVGLQVGAQAIVQQVVSNQSMLAANAYYSGSWKTVATQTGFAAVRLNAVSAGAISFHQNSASFTAGDALPNMDGSDIKMTILPSGDVWIGTTSNNVTNGGFIFSPSSGYGYGNAIIGHITGTSSGTNFAEFRYNNGTIGQISQNGTTNVTYNTSSDYRLKENIAPMTGALAEVAKLKPVTYTWKSDGSDGQGFIAHELAEVVPDCVTGAKDAVDEEGNPKYQGIDTSFLVATLTAAIQELKAINDTQAETINALTARIEALENK